MKSEYAEDLGIKTGTTSRNDLISSHAVLGEVAPEKVLGFYQCGRCGAELKKHNKNNFCYYCGIKLNWRNLA